MWETVVNVDLGNSSKRRLGKNTFCETALDFRCGKQKQLKMWERVKNVDMGYNIRLNV
jgi:hypothetical protein